MNRYETDNYLFHFHEDSTAQRDILHIAHHQEACFKYICSVLNVKPPFKIEYFLCATPDEVGRHYGDNAPCNGFARTPNQIYAVYHDTVQCIGFHEDAHLISDCINHPDSAAIREGLAMFFDKQWWGIHNQAWTAYFLRHGAFADVSGLIQNDIFYETDCAIAYPVVGCFTEYLILTYGMEKYLKLYRSSDEAAAAIEKIYHKTLHDLSADFAEYVHLFTLDPMVEKRMDALRRG